jgi:hypothetical protein
MQTYRGRITLADGDEVDVDLEMTDESIRLATDAVEIGRWTRAEFHIVRVDDGVFEIVIDGDRVSFEPFEPAPFEASVGQVGGPVLDGPSHPKAEDGDGEESGDDLEFSKGIGTPADPSPEGEEVAAWSLVTPNGSVENGWMPDLHVLEDPGPPEEASEPDPGEWPPVADIMVDDEGDDGALESAAVEEEPVELWSISGPRWSVVDADGGSGNDPAGEAASGEPAQEPEFDDAVADVATPEVESEVESEVRQGGADGEEPSGGDGDEHERGSEDGRRGSLFGGSSVERLAAAVGALKSSPAMTPAEEALAAAAEDDDDERSVAEGILATQRSLRETTVVKRFTWDLIRKVGAGVLLGVGIAAVVVLLPDAWEVLTRDEAPQVTTIDPDAPGATTDTTAVVATTVPVTTLPEQTTTTIAPDPTVFDLPASQFVESWNAVAAAIDPVLAFGALPPIGEFENQFFAQLSMLGVVGEDGTVTSFSLVIDPTGPAEADRLGIQALGVALKVLDPDSTGSSRAALLRSLGLDVDQPNLAGIDSSTDLGGVRYALRYDSETVRLTLSLSPVGPGET